MTTTAARQNTFAAAQTFGELYAMFRIATSPENIAEDSERTNAELNAHYGQLRADFEARDFEIYDALTNTSSRR